MVSRGSPTLSRGSGGVLSPWALPVFVLALWGAPASAQDKALGTWPSGVVQGDVCFTIGHDALIDCSSPLAERPEAPQTEDQHAVAICEKHIDPRMVYATNPPSIAYEDGWEICEKVDLEKAKREREAKDKADMDFLKAYVGEGK
jgi:hypothetical protein